ncbi:hypothetical protein [Jiella marina]|uniref:hypothetical protein n=1 Tax=Jiella sp. LLJ827 TaxID=2917712 RepID=UPI002100DF7C|nr:hypothetical protein [Jiella sp. LLJ827]MCQ0986425.1 hypothetical protein [Jiella sp. LLJ827]
MKPFTQDQIDAWEAAGQRKPPRIPDDAFERFAQIRSFEIGLYPNAVLLRMLSRNGDIADVMLNPHLARQIAATIITAGQSAGWLDANGRLIIPEIDEDPGNET